MRDITIITKNSLRYEDVHGIILKAFPDYKVFVDNPKDDDGRIWLYKGQAKIDIYFTPDYRVAEHKDEFEENQIAKIPFDGYFTTIVFRTPEAILRLIKCLTDAGIEIWVEGEDSTIVPACEFNL